MQHGHEEGKVEALWGQSRGQEWRDVARPSISSLLWCQGPTQGLSHTVTPWNKG